LCLAKNVIAAEEPKLLFPQERQPKSRVVANELHVMLSAYIRAQVVLCGFSFIFYSAVRTVSGEDCWSLFR
jgi:predicted PurR-regulated permease PerM